MRTGNVLLSAVHFFVVLFILAGGACSLVLSKMPALRLFLAEAFTGHPQFFFVLGYILIGVGLALLVGLFVLNGGQYYQVKMQPHKTSVDLNVIRHYMEEYWKDLFPHEKMGIDIQLTSTKKIALIAEFPQSISLVEQKTLLEKIEKELGSLLSQRLGYQKEFFLTIQLK